MPLVSQFYGILITMFQESDTKHIHAKYNEYKAVYDLNEELLQGELPNKQKKMVEAWISIHEEELKALW